MQTAEQLSVLKRLKDIPAEFFVAGENEQLVDSLLNVHREEVDNFDTNAIVKELW